MSTITSNQVNTKRDQKDHIHSGYRYAKLYDAHCHISSSLRYPSQLQDLIKQIKLVSLDSDSNLTSNANANNANENIQLNSKDNGKVDVAIGDEYGEDENENEDDHDHDGDDDDGVIPTFNLMSTNQFDHKLIQHMKDQCPDEIIANYGIHPWFSHLFTFDEPPSTTSSTTTQSNQSKTQDQAEAEGEGAAETYKHTEQAEQLRHFKLNHYTKILTRPKSTSLDQFHNFINLRLPTPIYFPDYMRSFQDS
ncbi:unnamed protein product [Ambrosiozyma monospora]|uniref:Unnamed protein product n=1 Tax=Ambrosiozyma monospora TaxID=43982 RepID=A0A9W6WHD8_AMBMO|nr:unnamed protein product [Ambrosiozyma monospora]